MSEKGFRKGKRGVEAGPEYRAPDRMGYDADRNLVRVIDNGKGKGNEDIEIVKYSPVGESRAKINKLQAEIKSTNNQIKKAETLASEQEARAADLMRQAQEHRVTAEGFRQHQEVLRGDVRTKQQLVNEEKGNLADLKIQAALKEESMTAKTTTADTIRNDVESARADRKKSKGSIIDSIRDHKKTTASVVLGAVTLAGLGGYGINHLRGENDIVAGSDISFGQCEVEGVEDMTSLEVSGSVPVEFDRPPAEGSDKERQFNFDLRGTGSKTPNMLDATNMEVQASYCIDGENVRLDEDGSIEISGGALEVALEPTEVLDSVKTAPLEGDDGAMIDPEALGLDAASEEALKDYLQPEKYALYKINAAGEIAIEALSTMSLEQHESVITEDATLTAQIEDWVHEQEGYEDSEITISVAPNDEAELSNDIFTVKKPAPVGEVEGVTLVTSEATGTVVS